MAFDFSNLANSVSKSVSKIGQEASARTKNVTENMRYNSIISDQKKIIQAAYESIGRKYYELYKENPQEDFMEEVGRIKAAYEQIEHCERQQAQLKNPGPVCTGCGAKLTPGALFCVQCGRKVEPAAGGPTMQMSRPAPGEPTMQMGRPIPGEPVMPMGRSVTVEPAAAGQPESNPSGVRFCSSCGAQLGSGMVFCTQCGAKVE